MAGRVPNHHQKIKMNFLNFWNIRSGKGFRRTSAGPPEGHIGAIGKLGPRLHHVHFSDSGVVSSELHYAPGTGCLDLDGIVAALKRIGFAGP